MEYGENMLKEKLIKVRENNYLLEGGEAYYEVALEMMESIGVLDPELRDKLIYTTFYHWIVDGRFTVEQLKDLLNISLENLNLHHEINGEEDHQVFKRAFSVLIVALILYKHRSDKFLCEETLYKVKNIVVEYMLMEKDLRGYVKEHGWSHSAAHTADALDELIQCDCFKDSDFMDILNSIKTKVCVGNYVYIDEEDERMVTVVENCIKAKNLNSSKIIFWLKDFKIENPSNRTVEYYHLKVNIKHFLRSLYFRLLNVEGAEAIIEEIKGLLNNL